MKRVVLIVGNRYQANVGGFIEEFENQNCKIDGIICLEPKKGVKYYAKMPFRVLKKLKPTTIKMTIKSAIRRLFGKEKIQDINIKWNNQGEGSKDLLTTKFDLFSYAAKNNIPIQLSLVLTPSLIKSYTKSGPVVFPVYGGGIISKKVLEIDNAEFMNAHMGEMPYFRGMNAIEWSVLEGKKPKVAIMIMNEKIDGGDVIWHKDISLSNEKSIGDLRRTGYIHCYKAMAEGIAHYLSDESIRKKQPKGAKYYYRMHDTVRKMTEQKLESIK